MEADIDKLNIEITSNSDKAAKSIDNLCGSLAKLKENAVKNTGLDKLNKQLAKLHETSQQLSGLKAHAERVNEFSATINKLSGLKIPSVTKMRNRIKQLVDMSHEMADFKGSDKLAENVNQICDALKPMEKMGKNTLAPFVNSLGKISDITKKFDNKSLQDFRNLIKEITSSIQPLISQVSKSERGLVSLNRIIQSTVSSNGNLASSNAAAVKSYTSVSSILTSTRAKLLAYGYALSRVIRVAKQWVDLSNSYIENLNLFSVAMGDEAQSALNYANTVNKALGIDVSDWIRNQGVFKQVTSGFGVMNDKANAMSKNLTQLGYDISSFFNIDVDEAMQKLQSGISGEIEPLRRLGYALDQTTLQQIAYSHGITENIGKMTQAQKSQLRYIAILHQSQNVMGDMARTAETPANAMRILEQQFTQLKRSIGNIISIVVQKLLPYIQVFVRLLGEASDYLAKLWGFELPKIDYSNVSNGLSNVSDEADNATDSVKKTAKQMQRLAGFDELNILSSNDNKSNESTSANSFDLGMDIPEYDFLTDIDKQTDELYKKFKAKLKELYDWWKKHKEIIKTIAEIIAGLWAISKIKKFVGFVKGLWTAFKNLSIIKTAKTWLKNFIDGFKRDKSATFFGKLKNGVKKFRDQLTPAQKLLGTVVGITMSSFGSYNLFKNLAKDTLNWKSALGDVAMIVGGLAVSWLFGGPVGLAVGLGVTAVGGLVGAIKGAEEEMEAYYQSIYDNAYETAKKFTPEQQKIIDKVGESSEKFNEFYDGYREKVSDANGDYTYYQNLWDELQDIVDQNGKIKQGYEDRAKVISGELNEALGLNIEIINNDEIKAYQNLAKEIDNVIQKKRMEANLETLKEDYINAKNEQANARVEFAEAQNAYLEQSKLLPELDEKASEAYEKYEKAELKYKQSISIPDPDYYTSSILLSRRDKAKEEYEKARGNAIGANEKVGELRKQVEEAENVLIGYNRTIEQYEGLRSAQVSGDENKIKQSLSNIEHDFISCTAGSKRALEQQVKDAKENYESLRQGLQNGIQGITQEQVNEAKNFVAVTEAELAKFNLNSIKEEYSSGNDYTGKELTKIKKNSDNSLTEIKRLYNQKAPGITKAMVDEMSKLNTEVDTRIQTLKRKISEGMDFDVEISFSVVPIASKEETQKLVQKYRSKSNYTGADMGSIIYNKNNIRRFASGGYPTTGQLFYAREDGIPEMVGKIGNQTAVANNSQIEKAIADAVYRAMTSASRSSSDGQPINVTVPVYIDGQKMDEQQYSYRQRQYVRSNARRN